MRQLLAMGLLALIVPAARAESIGEEGFLAALGDEHVAARALKEGLGFAEATRRRAGALANPRVEFWREEPDANPRVTNWTVAWVPPLDGRYRLGKEAAEKGPAAARERFGLDIAALRREVRGAFAGWSLGNERLDVLRHQLDLVGCIAQQQRERPTVGEESGERARTALSAGCLDLCTDAGLRRPRRASLLEGAPLRRPQAATPRSAAAEKGGPGFLARVLT